MATRSSICVSGAATVFGVASEAVATTIFTSASVVFEVIINTCLELDGATYFDCGIMPRLFF